MNAVELIRELATCEHPKCSSYCPQCGAKYYEPDTPGATGSWLPSAIGAVARAMLFLGELDDVAD